MAVAKRTSLALPVATPFDFGRSVEFLDGFAPCADGVVAHGDALVTGGFVPEPFVARLHVAGHGPAGRRTRSVDADDVGFVSVRVEWVEEPGDGSAVASRLDSFLSLSEDLSPLYDAAGSDPAFARAVADLYGYHRVRFPTPFEAACWAALSRRTPTPVAVRRKRSLAEALGRVVRVEESDLRLFPTPGRVAAAPETVRETVPRDSARAIVAAAEAFDDGEFSSLPTPELLARLAELRGFDPRSAAFVARRGFGRTSPLPLRDSRLRRAVADLYGLDDPSDADVERASDPYGDHRGYWAHYVRAWARLRGADGTDGRGDA